jgi:hypothetical protein
MSGCSYPNCTGAEFGTVCRSECRPGRNQQPATDLRTAAQQALEALNEVTGWQSLAPQRVMDEVEDALAALRAAIEAALTPGEPVACPSCGSKQVECAICASGFTTAPQRPAQPERRTGLPHCERSCEANAFQIEIRRLESALRGAVAAEREACAKICESLQDWPEGSTPYDCASAIRARNE